MLREVTWNLYSERYVGNFVIQLLLSILDIKGMLIVKVMYTMLGTSLSYKLLQNMFVIVIPSVDDSATTFSIDDYFLMTLFAVFILLHTYRFTLYILPMNI